VSNSSGQVCGQLDWLLTGFQRSAPGVVHAAVVSGDGLRVAASEHLDAQLGDQLSAATSGLVSLANGVAHLVQLGEMTQTIVELAAGHLFVTRIGENATLAVVADRDCDLGMLGHEMTLLATQVGHALTPQLRARHHWPPG
jgi:hypothetical protein